MFASSGDTVVHLGNLPWDIVGKIIKVGFESVYNMKLISPRWNVLASELLTGDRKYFPKLDEFIWGVDESGTHTVTVRIPAKYRSYFGFEEWHGPQIPKTFLKLARLQRYSRGLPTRSDFVPGLVRRCSSIDCAQITLDENFTSDKFRSLSEYMRNVSIIEVKFDVAWKLNEEAILEFVRAQNVKRLCLTTDECNVFEAYFLALLQPGGLVFFTQALQTAKSVELAVKTPVGIWAVLVEKYNRIAAYLARRLIVNLKSHTETLLGGEMRLRIIVTQFGDE